MKILQTSFCDVQYLLKSLLACKISHKCYSCSLQKAQLEIETHLKTAELLSLKGDTKGEKEQIVNELLKVHTRFQARITEYQLLLNMTIKFFEHLKQVGQFVCLSGWLYVCLFVQLFDVCLLCVRLSSVHLCWLCVCLSVSVCVCVLTVCTSTCCLSCLFLAVSLSL